MNRQGRVPTFLIWLLLSPFVLNTAPVILESLLPKFNLDGQWDVCVTDNIKNCDWHSTSFPGSVTLAKQDRDKLLVVKKVFDRPSCSSCSFFFGTASNPTDVFFNGVNIGRVGSPFPDVRYAQTYPGNFIIPANLVRDSQNELIAIIYPYGASSRGLIRGPIAIYETKYALTMNESLTASIVVLPLLAAFGLLITVILTVFASGESRTDFLRKYIDYCIVAAIYLVSLSRIPREYMSPTVGYGIHFALRFLLEITLLRLFVAFFDKRPKVVNIFFAIYLAIMVCCFATIFAPSAGVEVVFKLARAGVFFFPFIILFGLWYSLTQENLFERRLLTYMMAVTFVQQLWDIMALNGFITDIYFGRFYPLVIAIVLGYIHWNRVIESRKKEEVAARVGELATQVAHDIRAPLAAFNMLLSESTGLSADYRGLLIEATGRIKSIADDLLEKSQSTDALIPITKTLLKISKEKQRLYPHVHITVQADTPYISKMPTSSLERIFSNLIDNAIEAGAKELRVSAEVSGSSFNLTFNDDGKGIPANVLTQLGKKGATFGKKGGSGLGLYSSIKTLREHKGNLQICSEEGRGTSITLSFSS